MVKLILMKKDGSLFEEKNILSFVFSKDMYVPYTELLVRFKAQSEDFNNVCEVKLVSGGKEIHHGLLDNLDFYKVEDCFMCRIESRGFTSLLCQNQIEPGLKTNISFNSLKIIRHLYFDLDKQFLYSPQEALVYRDKYDKRAGLEYYCLYSGYNGEDLSDLVSFGSLQKRKISLVKIYGGSNGIFTELGVYVDDFNN